jgi:diketogulonate reductase-like aldo/keto reductase
MSAAPPPIIYGTAWKEAATHGLVRQALDAGFRAIDTANQRQHYDETAVGAAVAEAIRDGVVRRDDLFLQTKFTHKDGHDHRLPYDPAAPIEAQVAASFAGSLAHFGLPSLDCLLLHGPTQRDGLGPDDHAAWRAMEAVVAAGQVRMLGVSNVGADQLTALLAFTRTPIAFVQNRCYADRGWDRAVREVCAGNGIGYQAFSLLTANRAVVLGKDVAAIAARHQRSAAEVVLRFAQQRAMIPLTGTTQGGHMLHDLALGAFGLDETELATLDPR